jgi:hypothetical protein
VGGLSHFLEAEGLPTTQISLIREHTATIKPPRALWVPFELGRPLGAPGDAAFQRQVLIRVLSLLEAESGPVLEDFELQAPAGTMAAPDLLACPVSFDQTELEATDPETYRRHLANEIEANQPDYDRAVEIRGRTLVGPSGLGPREAAEFIVGFLDKNPPKNPRSDLSLAYALRLAVEDLKAFYFEAAAARLGPATPDPRAVADWFWTETVAGEVLLAVRERLSASPDRHLKFVGGALLAPVSHTVRATHGRP